MISVENKPIQKAWIYIWLVLLWYLKSLPFLTCRSFLISWPVVRHGILHEELHRIPENNCILIFLPQGSAKSQSELRKREINLQSWLYLVVFLYYLAIQVPLFREEIQSNTPWHNCSGFITKMWNIRVKQTFLRRISLMYINHIWTRVCFSYCISFDLKTDSQIWVTHRILNLTNFRHSTTITGSRLNVDGSMSAGPVVYIC